MSEQQILMTPFGSHLYGTATPTSDFDFKVLVLPHLDDIIMGKKIANYVVKPEGLGHNASMPEGGIEHEFIPIHIFLDHFFEGQTYALEMAMAVLQGKFDQPIKISPDYIDVQEWMAELVDKFLTKNIQKMIGYVVSQSNMYGLKTDRYDALVKIKQVIDRNFKDYSSASIKAARLSQTPELIQTLLTDYPSFVSVGEIPNARGGAEMSPALIVATKQFPLTTSWAIVLDSITKNIGVYGDRVKKFGGQGADWKALSHAIRIIEQIIDLCEEGMIEFPRPHSAYLKEVKAGQVSIEDATAYLTELFNSIEKTVASSSLQEITPELTEEFQTFKLALIKRYYKL